MVSGTGQVYLLTWLLALWSASSRMKSFPPASVVLRSTNIPDERRTVYSLTPSLVGDLAAAVDCFGRVLLLDCGGVVVRRMWKGTCRWNVCQVVEWLCHVYTCTHVHTHTHTHTHTHIHTHITYTCTHTHIHTCTHTHMHIHTHTHMHTHTHTCTHHIRMHTRLQRCSVWLATGTRDSPKNLALWQEDVQTLDNTKESTVLVYLRCSPRDSGGNAEQTQDKTSVC